MTYWRLKICDQALLARIQKTKVPYWNPKIWAIDFYIISTASYYPSILKLTLPQAHG